MLNIQISNKISNKNLIKYFSHTGNNGERFSSSWLMHQRGNKESKQINQALKVFISKMVRCFMKCTVGWLVWKLLIKKIMRSYPLTVFYFKLLSSYTYLNFTYLSVSIIYVSMLMLSQKLYKKVFLYLANDLP